MVAGRVLAGVSAARVDAGESGTVEHEEQFVAEVRFASKAGVLPKRPGDRPATSRRESRARLSGRADRRGRCEPKVELTAVGRATPFPLRRPRRGQTLHARHVSTTARVRHSRTGFRCPVRAFHRPRGTAGTGAALPDPARACCPGRRRRRRRSFGSGGADRARAAAARTAPGRSLRAVRATGTARSCLRKRRSRRHRNRRGATAVTACPCRSRRRVQAGLARRSDRSSRSPVHRH